MGLIEKLRILKQVERAKQELEREKQEFEQWRTAEKAKITNLKVNTSRQRGPKKMKNEFEERNRTVVQQALRELKMAPTKGTVESGYNACCGALGVFRKWSKQEVINYLRNHWIESDAYEFLEDLEMKGRIKRR